ncbi:unnamed protein product [Vicia faba]|uniref:Miraculin-like n=1 Tax=Vicia faba TaxID=3906 RepID=A0AAV0Z4D3_VICFA|nr:unnamed protein product [Vicia faba]
MKNTLLAFLLLIVLSSQPLLGSSQASPEQVLDIKGKNLRANTYYNVLLSMPYTNCKSPEGLGLSSNIDQPCPLDIIVVSRYQSLPIRFTLLNPKKGIIRVSSDLNIMFDSNSSCPYHTTVWKLDRFNVSKEKSLIITDGFIGAPGPHSIGNWFKIEKYVEGYKFVYCPSVCSSCKHECKDVGLFVDENGNRRLALTDVPYQVKFVKA